MNDVDQLIAVCQSLCNTLDTIAENERKFGHELCCKFGDMAYEAYKINCELANLKESIRGYL
jgi:hypothetical protein